MQGKNKVCFLKAFMTISKGSETFQVRQHLGISPIFPDFKANYWKLRLLERDAADSFSLSVPRDSGGCNFKGSPLGGVHILFPPCYGVTAYRLVEGRAALRHPAGKYDL